MAVDARRGGRFWWLLPLAAGAAGAAIFQLSAPDYLTGQGFPLDDAWIHSVYARELARSGTLAYNPGVPATGETSPLWAVAIALVYLVSAPPTSIFLTKILGLAMHLGSAVLFGIGLTRVADSRRWLPWTAGSLVAIHPDLLAASVSGMEVPLATLVTAAAFVAVVDAAYVRLAVLAVAATVARPESAVLPVALALLFWLPTNTRRAFALGASALAGGLAALALVSLRNWHVTGLPLPATFYVKANIASPLNSALQIQGFTGLLGYVPLLNVPIVVVALAVVALTMLRRRAAEPLAHAASALFIAGMGFCAVSFALVPPVDPPAFYHQRYALPGAALMIAATPLLVDALLGRLPQPAMRRITAVASVLFALLLLSATPARAKRLSNDARNIDDVQVAFGKTLHDAATDGSVWVVDAGASRFFGRPFVVDTIGLNTPELLTAGAQQYMDAHPPAYLDVFPGWSAIQGDPRLRFAARSFETTTPYTVTSALTMRTHVLVTCAPAGTQGVFVVRARQWRFRCSP
jgi:hypothetical protein